MKTGLQAIIGKFEQKQIIISILGLFLIIVASIFTNRFLLQTTAEESTRFVSRMIQVDDLREATLILNETYRDSFQRIEYKSEKSGRSFTIPDLSGIYEKPGFFDQIALGTIVLEIENPLQKRNTDRLIFFYDRLRLVGSGFLIWLLLVVVSIPQTRYMKKKLIQQFEKDLLLEKGQIKSEIASQVRHNLRTPLAALMRIPSRLPESAKEDRDLLTNSIWQIKKITAALDEKQYDFTTGVDDLFTTLNECHREIELTIPSNITYSFEINDNVISTKVPHIPHEMRALLGNLVNNSIDAIGIKPGEIKTSIYENGVEVIIQIEDNGPGISSELKERIFEKGFSSKPTGTGLGLYHANYWVTNWGGRITVESTVGYGSKFEIILPIKERESWFLPRLKIKDGEQIIILEDQFAARELWRLRLQESGALKAAHILSNSLELENLNIPENQMHLFFDYDLGENQNGLDLLERFPQAATRCLATGHFDASEVRSRCESMKLYLLPKSQIADLPIVKIF